MGGVASAAAAAKAGTALLAVPNSSLEEGSWVSLEKGSWVSPHDCNSAFQPVLAVVLVEMVLAVVLVEMVLAVVLAEMVLAVVLVEMVLAVVLAEMVLAVVLAEMVLAVVLAEMVLAVVLAGTVLAVVLAGTVPAPGTAVGHGAVGAHGDVVDTAPAAAPKLSTLASVVNANLAGSMMVLVVDNSPTTVANFHDHRLVVHSHSVRLSHFYSYLHHPLSLHLAPIAAPLLPSRA
jgi:hypothetical protein